MKKAGAEYRCDISATRLSLGDPIGFPPHPHGWFSIIVYHEKSIYAYTFIIYLKAVNQMK